ncbi:hypothetical protein B0H10DRAFT_1968271 [Mycena sp. CBHHK59/15]|nr:hypothetical protein B0H10DRAFT_1968271 [Mycena sp. CBHHK59/15]
MCVQVVQVVVVVVVVVVEVADPLGNSRPHIMLVVYKRLLGRFAAGYTLLEPQLIRRIIGGERGPSSPLPGKPRFPTPFDMPRSRHSNGDGKSVARPITTEPAGQRNPLHYEAISSQINPLE